MLTHTWTSEDECPVWCVQVEAAAWMWAVWPASSAWRAPPPSVKPPMWPCAPGSTPPSSNRVSSSRASSKTPLSLMVLVQADGQTLGVYQTLSNDEIFPGHWAQTGIWAKNVSMQNVLTKKSDKVTGRRLKQHKRNVRNGSKSTLPSKRFHICDIQHRYIDLFLYIYKNSAVSG